MFWGDTSPKTLVCENIGIVRHRVRRRKQIKVSAGSRWMACPYSGNMAVVACRDATFVCLRRLRSRLSRREPRQYLPEWTEVRRNVTGPLNSAFGVLEGGSIQTCW